jgi:hypothetical protein
VQPNVQVGFTVAFSIGVGKGALKGEEAALKTGGAGTKQPVRQFATCELHNIIQLVTVEVTGVESPVMGGVTFGVVAVCANTALSALE